MTTFVLKRKLYADEENRGMSTGKKVALGVAGAGAAAAGLFAGARRGYLGTGLMKKSNSLWGRTGVKLQNIGLNKMGNSMVESAGNKYGDALGREARTRMLKHNAIVGDARLSGKSAQDVAKTRGYFGKQGLNEFTTQQMDANAKQISKRGADKFKGLWRRELDSNKAKAVADASTAAK